MDNTILELRKFVAPEIIFGIDARHLIKRYLSHFNASHPMIVTDRSVRSQIWFQEIFDAIETVAQKIEIFDDVSPNPRDFEAMMGAEIFLSHDCDIIIAIGGGSPIDCAKCISIVSTNGNHILSYEGVDQIKLPGPPLICIPSTSGTSADVSQFAIITDTNDNVKRAIISKKVVPDLALIDPVPLMTMDNYLTACTGMDALTHAIEAYVSNAHSILTDVHALQAITLIGKHITNSIKEDRDLETMYHMMSASLQAGLAFSNASLGAVHAMAHALGGLLDLAHGECNSILLEHIIKMNFDSASERYTDIAKALNINLDGLQPIDICVALTDYISEMRSQLGINAFIPINILEQKTLTQLVEAALNDPCMITNPKEPTFEELRSIYERILKTNS